MRAFVIRGFGRKAGVDFDRVHAELITPALREVGAEGGTTGEIVEAGNVREDMFRELVLADVVIADVSVHNANVFYELGIRHAVRNRATVLVRARIDEVPFDLRTDRYLSYDPADPAAAVPQLVQVLRGTLATERVDSPVFQLLPGFTPGPHATLLDLPRDLAEDIEQAREAKRAGDLRLIAQEVVGLRFEEAALRAAARASSYVGDDVGAQRAWERIRTVWPDDPEANRALSDVYRRLGHLVASDQAIERVLGGGTLSGAELAELYALRGSNSKRRWVVQWRQADERDRARVALRSRELEVSYQFYRRGFGEDLNHWYSGLNALALAKITVELAERCPQEWQMRFDTDAEAARQKEWFEAEVAWLTSTVRASLDSARARSRRTGLVDFWLEVSLADLRFLTSGEPERVGSAYEAAMSPILGSAARRSIREQLEMHRDLGILVDNAAAALSLLAGTPGEETVKVHPLVFSGHMIDRPGRPHPRFPPGEEHKAEAEIERAIRTIVTAAQERGETVIGIAGVADGGDLLFHEACHRLGVQTQVFLPVPELVYRATAMSRQASRWADRYHAALRRATKVLTLARTDTLPGWLQAKPNYSTWQRSNRWILHHAWATTTADRVTVLALWNGQVGDGPGGVADMVATAQAGGAAVITLDTSTLFELPEPDPPPDDPGAAEGTAASPGTTTGGTAGGPGTTAGDTAGTGTAASPGTTVGSAAGTGTAANARAVVGAVGETGTGADPVAGADAVPAVSPAATAQDRVLNLVWRRHRQWSLVADAARSRIDRWRRRNLALLMLGALAGALAAQTWLPSALETAFAIVAAVLLAIAGWIQTQALASDQTARWTGARAASEALKAETYRYLTRVDPYAGADRAERLNAQLTTIQTRAQDLLADQQLATPDDRPQPSVHGFDEYLTARAQKQADWHRTRSGEHARTARTLRVWQLLATGTGVVLGAAGGVLPGLHLSAWIAAATTIAAAIGTHLAALQHQRIATSYAATADQIDRLIAELDPAGDGPERQARFVANVERVLAAQNDSWIDLFSTRAAEQGAGH